MEYNSDFKRSLFLVRKSLIILVLLAFVAQLSIDQNLENIYCNILALGIFISTCLLIFNPSNSAMGYALTGTVVFLNITANSLVPMLGTVMEGHALTYSLLNPVETFLHRTIFGFTLLIAQTITKSNFFFPILSGMSELGAKLKSRVLFAPSRIWALGVIGLSAYLLKYLPLPVALIKILDAFGFLMWVPFLLLVPPYSLLNSSSQKKKLIAFYVVQIAVSFASNSRMGMIGPIAVAFSASIVALLLGSLIVNQRFLRQLLITGVLGIFFIGQFIDLSTAILIERNQRTSRGVKEQIGATIDRFFDKKSLIAYRSLAQHFINKNTKFAQKEWQENYIENPFLARFAQIKFDDNCFNRLHSFNDDAYGKLKEATVERVLALMPTPLLELLDIHIDKEQVNSYSIGDLIEVLSGRGYLGGFRTGSIPAHAYAVFGWWYPIFLCLIYCLIFSLFQGLLTDFKRKLLFYGGLSTFGLLICFQLFNDISLDGVTSLTSMLFRNFWQVILFYFISSKLLRVFPRSFLSFSS